MIRGRPSLAVGIAALLCFAPLLASLRSIADPFGQTEEGVNAAIWALGGRNIKELGWREARFGALVKPLWPEARHIYAHHPPLPVWLSSLWMLFGNGEALPRTLALLGMAVALWFLFQSLRLYVDDWTALIALAAPAMSVYLTRYGRLFSTMTLAIPLFCAALWLVLRAHRRNAPPSLGLLLLVPALVFSSWDGVVGAGVICALVIASAFIGKPDAGRALPARAVLVGVVGLASLALLLFYFREVNGSLTLLIEQARYRSGAGRLSWGHFLRTQSWFLRQGLGIVNLAVCASALILALVRRNVRPLAGVAVVASIPALAMTLLMRDGAAAHWFWAINLVIPLPFLVAAALETVSGTALARSSLIMLLLGQNLYNYALGAMLLGEERGLNSAGAFFREVLPKMDPGTVRVFAGYDFHPYLAWYGRRSHQVALSIPQLLSRVQSDGWALSDEVLVDTRATEYFRCRAIQAKARSSTGRWIETSVGALVDACTGANR